VGTAEATVTSTEALTGADTGAVTESADVAETDTFAAATAAFADT
jgi:hypothetical protein